MTWAQDPAETWEAPYTELGGGFYFRDRYAGHPSVPKKPGDLPAGAFESLQDTCGVKELGHTLIIPSCVRATARGNRRVITPLQVLAVGDIAVGLWAEKPQPGVKVCIALDKLSAIEDVQWDFLLNYPYSTLDESAPRDFRFSVQSYGRHGKIARCHMMIVTPYELISLRDPPQSELSYGVDSLFMARARIQSVARMGNTVEVTANGARFALPTTPALIDAMDSWFAVPV